MLRFEIIVKYQYHWCHFHSLDMCNAVPVICIGKLSVFWHFEKLTNNGFELRLEFISSSL